MKIIYLLLGILLLPVLSSANQPPKTPSVKCDIGPLNKMYGNYKWLVYSCDDNHSLLFLAAPDNPAAPFHFMFYPENTHYRLIAEGTGSKEATKATYDELQKLTATDLMSLIVETKHVK